MIAVRATDQTVSVRGTLDPFGVGGKDTSAGRVELRPVRRGRVLDHDRRTETAVYNVLRDIRGVCQISCLVSMPEGVTFVQQQRKHPERPW